ncbi:MAG: GTPase HflX [Planctomycetota bacterium]
MARESRSTDPTKERLVTCGVLLPGQPNESEGPLSEVRALVEAAEAEVVGDGLHQSRMRPHPATLFGKGKVDEIGSEVKRICADAVVVDNDLTPAQGRNLEKAWGTRVIDRSELILDIFSRRAQTQQARLQVELAQNIYLLPRLRRMWTHLERMEGAIGTRGPGETQLETDRRLLNKRITDLKRELSTIEKRKQREVGARTGEFVCGLVGYTNAGKSTLLNRLTGSDEFAADMPFATLDTRTRRWVLPDRRTVLLSDTVGFLQRLPHHLVASFHATLEETLHADLLLHVVDASNPDAAHQMRAVEEVLAEVSPHLRPDVVVFNKVDRVVDRLGVTLLEGELQDEGLEVVHVSAKSGEGLDELTDIVRRRLDDHSGLVEVHVEPGDGRTVALVRGAGAVQEEDVSEDGAMRMRVRLSPGALGVLRRKVGGAARFVAADESSAMWLGMDQS